MYDITVTPLELALELMDHQNYNTLHSNTTQIAKILLKAGAESNPPEGEYGDHLTLLQLAACRRDQAEAYDLVQLLLIAGASVDARRGNSLENQTAL